jgi:hypothetical protein
MFAKAPSTKKAALKPSQRRSFAAVILSAKRKVKGEKGPADRGVGGEPRKMMGGPLMK